MELLGVVDVSESNGIVVVAGAGSIPDIGDPVFDPDRNKIGTVKRIFGPVEGPFITVAVDSRAVPNKLLGGKELYFTRRTQNGKDKRRNRRD